MVLRSDNVVDIQLTGWSAEDVAEAAIRIRFSTGAKFGRVWMSRKRRGRDVGLWLCDGTVVIEDLTTVGNPNCGDV